MDDLSICKRIAEIEGIKLLADASDITGNLQTAQAPYLSYNPLTDDGLCFGLMVKHGISFGKRGPEYYATAVIGDTYKDFFNKSPNKSICLAVIAANEG